MSEKLVVIGSNSFSGAHFVDFALEKGAEVIGLSRSVEPHAVFMPYAKRKSPSFRFVQADLNHDLGNMLKIMEEFKPSYVVNFAAQSMVGESWQNPDHWFQTNVVANVRLHDRLRSRKWLKKYVHISTPEVYGTCQGLIQENTLYNPSTPYAVSRVATDLSLMTFFRNYSFPVVFTRAANVFGPCQQLYRIIPRAILFFLLGKKLPLHGGGHSVRSFIHIRDVAEGTWRAAIEGEPGKIFHFSTPTNISIRDVVRKIAELLGVSYEEMVEIVEDRPGKDSAYLLDSSKAKSELAWAPEISLEKGLQETISWVKSNIDVLKHQPQYYIHKP